MKLPPRPAANIRSDLEIMSQMIAPNTRVLDIGSGDGSLISHLFRTQGCDARGIELDMAEVTRAVAHGLPVMHGDADTDLAHYPDGLFDYVVLSRTLQAVERPREVLRQMLRIGTRALGQLPQFRPLARALAAALVRPHADDADLEHALVRNAEHPPVLDPGLLRPVRPGGLRGRAMAGIRRSRAYDAVAQLPGLGEPVRRTSVVLAQARLSSTPRPPAGPASCRTASQHRASLRKPVFALERTFAFTVA